MKRIVLSLALALACLSANAQLKEGFQTDKSGVKYRVDQANPEGRQVKADDIVIGGYAIAFGDSLAMTTLSDAPQPCFRATMESNVFKGDLMEGLFLMREGETYTFAFERDSLAKVQQLPPYFRSGDYGYYTVRIDKLLTQAEFDKEIERQQKEMQHYADSMQNLEMQVLIDYVRANGFSDIATDGVYYKQTSKGNGKTSKSGDKLRVHYVGKFLDGRLFDTSVEAEAKSAGMYNAQRDYSPLEFTLGRGQMIKGFEAAAARMQEGEKGVVVIPSALAYGARQRGEIPAFSTLVFELEVVEIIENEQK